MPQKINKCLVIGGNGFIGSHLVDDLAKAGYSVRALDRFSSVQRFNSSDSVELLKGSTFDPGILKSALKNVRYVFISMSATTPYTSDCDPYTDIQKNLVHNVEIIEASVKAKVQKVIFISSGGAVYGNKAEEEVVYETDAPQPISPYGINKLATEYYLEYFKRKYGLEYVIYRLTNPYGSRQTTHKNQGVIPTFIDKILCGEELVVYGSGNATRDYIYIGDATKMMVETFALDNRHNVYNLGSGKQTSLLTVIKTVEKILGVGANYRCIEAPKTFLEKTMVSSDRFIKEFGIRPKFSLEEGLKIMLSDALVARTVQTQVLNELENSSVETIGIPKLTNISKENIELAM